MTIKRLKELLDKYNNDEKVFMLDTYTKWPVEILTVCKEINTRDEKVVCIGI